MFKFQFSIYVKAQKKYAICDIFNLHCHKQNKTSAS